MVNIPTLFLMRRPIGQVIMMMFSYVGDWVSGHEIKNGKTVAKDGIPAKVFKDGPVQLSHVRSIFFTGCLKFNYFPKSLMDVVVTSIIK